MNHRGGLYTYRGRMAGRSLCEPLLVYSWPPNLRVTVDLIVWEPKRGATNSRWRAHTLMASKLPFVSWITFCHGGVRPTSEADPRSEWKSRTCTACLCLMGLGQLGQREIIPTWSFGAVHLGQEHFDCCLSVFTNAPELEEQACNTPYQHRVRTSLSWE